MGTKWQCGICALVVCGLILPAVVPAAEPGLVGWWKLDETSGLSAADSSGFGNVGTLTNMGADQWVPGIRDGALEFTGNRNYVNCGTGSSLDIANDFTIAVWVKLAAGTDSVYGGIAGRLTRKDAATDYWGFALVRHSSNVFRLWVADGNASAINNMASSDVPYTDTGWHHVAGLRRGKQNLLFVDGVQQRETSSSEFIASKQYFSIGKQYDYLDDRYFVGLIDDVRLYNRALSTAEIQELALRPKAHDPNPADGEQNVVMPLLRWVPGSGAATHNVYFGTTPTLGQAEFMGSQFMPMYFHLPGVTPGTVYFWRVDEMAADGTVVTGDVWSFTSVFTTAYNPSPRNGAKWVATDAGLSWSMGQNTASHDVYFGTSLADVAAGAASTFKGNQLDASFNPGVLAEQTTYYWRVDERDDQGVKQPGPVWRFTTLGPGGGVKGEYFNGKDPGGAPALSRIDPSIDFNWGDPGGPGALVGVDNFCARWTADLEVAFTDAYTFLTNSDDGVRLWVNNKLIIDNWTDHSPTVNRGRITLQAGQVYPLRMEYYEAGGGAVAQLSWESPTMARAIIPAGPLQPPVRARAVYPRNGDVNVPQDVTLIWSAGEKAVKHAVYFGDDAAAVAAADTASGLYKGVQALDKTTFNPGLLEWNKSYYWRVDEVNDASADSPWQGAVWSFTTANFLVVDDMERYTDEEGTNGRIYETWIDGWADNSSGSTIGNTDPPFAEQTIVHGGRQSMPMDYNNINSPYFSEAYREFAPVQNWTVRNVTDLVLWFRGWPAPPAVNEAGGKFTVSGAGTDIGGTADQFTFVYKTLSGDGSISARVLSNGTGSNRWAKGGVMIRDSLAAGAPHAMQVITGGDGNGASFQYRTEPDGASTNSDATAAVPVPYYVKIERVGDTFSASLSADGKTWTLQGTSQYVAMTNPVCMGLCVTSHAGSEVRTYQFDTIKTTGAVSSVWKAADVGFLRNSPQSLYLAIEDSAGKKATVVHPDAGVVNVTEWTSWQIPLSSLSGVNLTKVKRLYLGVGDRTSPSPDGTGRLYFDDIRVIAR